MSLAQALLSALLGLLTGLGSGIAGSYIGFHWWPTFRRRAIWNGLRVVQLPLDHHRSFRFRIANMSGFTMGKAVAYVTIYHKPADVVLPPEGREAYIVPEDELTVDQAQLCWEVQESGKNPMRVDIYAGEQLPLAIGVAPPDGGPVEIFSEACRKPARAFLWRKNYKAVIKVVCLDCPAKEFQATLNVTSCPPRLDLDPSPWLLDTPEPEC
jgi:hypothetical protein